MDGEGSDGPAGQNSRAGMVHVSKAGPPTEGMEEMEDDQVLEELDPSASIELMDVMDGAEMVDLDAVVAGATAHTVQASVKMKLNTFCSNADVAKKLRSIVVDMNQVMGEAYAFENFHILRVLQDGEEVPRIDRNFYYRCILAVSISNCRKSTLGESINQTALAFDLLRPQSATKVNIVEYNQVVADTSITMATMGCNHLWMNLKARLDRYLAWKHPRLRRFHAAIVRAVITEPTKDVSKVIKTAAMYKPLKKKQAKVAKPVNDVQSDKPKRACKPKVPSAKAVAAAAEKALKQTRHEQKYDTEASHMQDAIHVASELRNVMQLPSSSQFESRAHLTLPLYYKMLADTETGKCAFDAYMASLPLGHKDLGSPGRRRKAFKGRLFTMLPVKSGFTISHIPISSMMLMGMLKKMGLEKHDGDGRDLDPRFFWDKYFNLKLVETRRRAFRNRIVTDGCAVSALISCTVQPCQSECRGDSIDSIQKAVACKVGEVADGGPADSIRKLFAAVSDELLMAGIDPGFTDVITVYFSDGTTKSFSSARYYERAKVNHSRRATKKMNAATVGMTDTLKGGKTANLNALSDYLRMYLQHLPGLLKHRFSQRYRDLRFLRFTFRRKTINEICDMVAPAGAPLTCIGFGDWSGGHKSPISRKCAGPTKDISKELHRRHNTMLKPVSEHMSSQLDSNTGTLLVNMKAYTTKTLPDGSKQTVFNKKVHKVLHCKTSDASVPRCKETTWNRDVNAARNIMTLFMLESLGHERPAAFCRPTKTPIANEATKEDHQHTSRVNPCPGLLSEAPVSVSAGMDQNDGNDLMNGIRMGVPF